MQKNRIKRKRRSIEGLCADLDIHITETDIAKARREMWGGWELKRVNGSHHIYTKIGISGISIPIHGNKPLKIRLQKHIMKMADINETEL
ncbi:MAG: type II toxin-antitoxin system HicA family toxin [Thiomargarita sp.]|nr:type II toxin-antitoxin system HicA family toxin [Thiomargarita sp.]